MSQGLDEPTVHAYIKLMGLFEGGSLHWSGLYQEHGARALIEMIEGGAFSTYKKIGVKLQESAKAIDAPAKVAEMQAV